LPHIPTKNAIDCWKDQKSIAHHGKSSTGRLPCSQNKTLLIAGKPENQ